MSEKTCLKPFDRRVDDSNGPDACWPWTGARNSNGYGIRHLKAKNTLAHRIAYEAAYGPIPPGLLVCHHCDNRPCCNPKHLFVGTHWDNTKDMIKKGRTVKGKSTGAALKWLDFKELSQADELSADELQAVMGERRPALRTGP